MPQGSEADQTPEDCANAHAVTNKEKGAMEGIELRNPHNDYAAVRHLRRINIPHV
ncbi:hypothetical protein TMM008_21300 [Pseudomonas sp. 008]|nr:hypothetical protein TMM008_21300 [Pseudomonas sp. 008]